MSRWLRELLVLVALILLLPSASQALTFQQNVLVGLEGVNVVVSPLDSTVRHLGLTESQIQTDVELRLQKAGVRVLTVKEQVETPGGPFLYVTVTANIWRGCRAYTVLVELYETVTLVRGFQTAGVIWKKGVIRTSTKIPKERSIRDTLSDVVDVFINDYLAANPK